MAPSIERFTNTKTWIFLGFLFLTVFVGGMILWALVAPISGAIIAQGVIGIEGKAKVVQHLDGGIVEEILIKNGDMVDAGTLLVRLVDTDLRAQLSIITDSYVEANAKSARLRAERDRSETIEFAQFILDLQHEQGIANIIDAQVLQFRTRAENLSNRQQVLQQKSLQLQEQIAGFVAQRAAISTQQSLVEEEISIKAPAVESGVIARNVLVALKQLQAQLIGQYEELASAIAQARGAIEETKLQTLQLEIDFQDNLLMELAQTQNDIAELGERKIAAEERLRRVEIRAPSAGRVHDLSVHTVGGVVMPGASIMQIIPVGENLIIEVRITTTDIDAIKIGQESSVRLSAFEVRSTPSLVGFVKNISAAQLVDQFTGASYFSIELEVSAEQLARLEEDQVLVPGMPVEAFVKTGERNAFSYLLAPFFDVIDRAFRE